MAEPAFSYNEYSQTVKKPLVEVPRRQPDLEVVPRRNPRQQPEKTKEPVVFIFTKVFVLALGVAVLFTFIWLTSETMFQMATIHNLEESITKARSAGYDLESQYSAMTNPQNIQLQARAQGMSQDTDPGYLYIDSDSQQIAAVTTPDSEIAPLGEASAEISSMVYEMLTSETATFGNSVTADTGSNIPTVSDNNTTASAQADTGIVR